MYITFLSPEYPTPSCPEGWLANFLRKVGAALAARGHRVTVFVASDRNAAWNDNGMVVKEVGPLQIPSSLSRHAAVTSVSPYSNWIMSSRRLASARWSRHLQEPSILFKHLATRRQAIGCSYSLRHGWRMSGRKGH